MQPESATTLHSRDTATTTCNRLQNMAPRRFSPAHIALLLSAATAVASVWLLQRSPSASPTPSPQTSAVDTRPTLTVTATAASAANATAQHWIPTDEPDAVVTEHGISLQAINNVIALIRLDKNQLVLDSETRRLLEQVIDPARAPLSPEQIQDIQEVLLSTLPNPAGQDAADLLEGFYQYRKAALQADQTNDSALSDNERFEALVAMRESTLGTALTAKLYGQDQAYQRFSFAQANLMNDPQLDEAERNQRAALLRQELEAGFFHLAHQDEAERLELQQQLAALELQTANPELQHYLQRQAVQLSVIATKQPRSKQVDWQQRYAAFISARDTILSAGLSDSDKLDQLEQIRSEYFTDSEWTAAQQRLALD